MLYAVIPTQDSHQKLKERMDFLASDSGFGMDICEVEAPNIYIVDYPGSSDKLYKIIKFGPESDNSADVLTGVILPITEDHGYYGYTSRTFWHWIDRNL